MFCQALVMHISVPGGLPLKPWAFTWLKLDKTVTRNVQGRHSSYYVLEIIDTYFETHGRIHDYIRNMFHDLYKYVQIGIRHDEY